jgi:IclR family pca regulon transcriptional regulator
VFATASPPARGNGKSKADGVQLRTVGRAADVLELLVAEGAVSLKDVQRRLNLGHTVAHRILRTWTALEFLQFDAERKVYRAGTKLLWAGMKVRAALAHPGAEGRVSSLSEQLGFNAHIGLLDGRLVIYVASSKGRHAMPYDVELGSATPAGSCAMGRVLLAYQPEHRVVQLYSQGGALATADNETAELLRDLRLIRKQGYCVSTRTFEAGTGSVAVPLRDTDGRIVAALNVVGPINAFTNDSLPTIVATLIDAARDPIELPPLLSGQAATAPVTSPSAANASTKSGASRSSGAACASVARAWPSASSARATAAA